MLFILTGEVQTGKTRWLESLVADLARCGVVTQGVVAPGVWRKRTPEELSAIKRGEVDASSLAVGLGSAGVYEKLGIDNRLLPSGEVISFARRRDLAKREGRYDPESQSARGQLGWEISDLAIERVNAHFDALLAQMREGKAALARGGAGLGVRDADANVQSDACAQTGAQASAHAGAQAGAQTGARPNGSAQACEGGAGACDGQRFLVVDELGRLELERGAGLTSALALLDEGPLPRCPHALVVVRAALEQAARARLEPVWGAACAIAPDGEGHAAVMRAFGLLSASSASPPSPKA